MKLKILLLLLFLFGGYDLKMQAEILYYTHSDLHLNFTIDTETKEATLGTGTASDQNAIARPPLDDPWWNESPQTNYWKDLNIPQTIVCEGTAYKITGEIVSIKEDTYTVTAVSSNAFCKSLYLYTINLPETIKEIGPYAFSYCINLTSINIPDLVSEINAGTFYYCNKLKSLYLPNNVCFIGTSAFSDCTGLEEINIPGKCSSIKEEAFKWCTSLSKLIIEDGSAPLKLAYCHELGINYEGTMPEYYRGMFSDCPLKTLYLGRDIEFYSDYIIAWYPPFMGYYYKGKGTNNKDIFIEEGKIYDEVTIGDEVTTIPESMFQYATIPNAITLPSHLKSIGDDAFSNRSGTSGTLHQSQLVFPATLESIGKNAFTNCTGLGTIVCEGTTPPALPDELYYHAFWNCNPLFIVPSGCRTTYLNAENWSTHKIIEASDEVITVNVKTAGSLLDKLIGQGYQLNTISRLKLKGTLNEDDWANVKKMTVLYDLDISELNLEEISTSQFQNSSLIYIKLPNTIKKISDNAFYKCVSLTGIIEIPSLCTEIGTNAFRETGITGLLFDGPIHINSHAFSNCLNLENLEIKGNGTIVDQYGFINCGLKKLTIGKGVTLGEDAIALCDQLKEVTLEDGVSALGNQALYNKIEIVNFEGSIGEIGRWVLRNEYLKEIHISDIGKWCELPFPENFSDSHPLSSSSKPKLYYDGEELVDIEIPEGVKRIGSYSFMNCDKLKSVKSKGRFELIGNYAFKGCTQLKNIQLSSKLESIGGYAFNGCSSLTEIDLPLSITNIGEYAFSNCSNLTNITVHWKDPITVNSNTFAKISTECSLFIPVGTASKYSNAGWSVIPIFKPRGVLKLSSNIGGTISCLDNTCSNETKELLFEPYKSFNICVLPNDGYKIVQAKLNNMDVSSEINNSLLLIDEPEEDLDFNVYFSDIRLEKGDVNGDFTKDNSDAIMMASFVLYGIPENFLNYWADMNGDGIINITDIIILVSKFAKKN